MQDGSTKHVHDYFFKSTMSDIKVMESAVQNYMPEAIKKHLNLNTLSLCSGSYIDENLKQTQSDILYSVECNNGEPGYIYLLWEHQSTSDWKMPLRLLNYSLRIMEQHISQGHNQLPLVIPAVVYNGVAPYKFSTDLFEMFENPGLARQLMFSPFNLVDLPSVEDEEIAQGFWEAWPFMILKHMRTKDFSEQTLKLIKVSQRISKEGGELHLKNMLKFTIEKLQVANPVKLDELLEKTPKEVSEKMATAAQIWEQKGMQQGMQQGKEQGIAAVAFNMVRNNYDIETISKLTALTPRQIKALVEERIKE